MPDFAVIGLGRFGRAVARSLVRDGQAVLAVDLMQKRLERLAEEVDATARADTTNEEAVKALRLDRMSSVVVAIGSRATEASLLTVAILRELEVPRIVARAFDDRHARLLLAIGAHEVLIPEDEMGARLALRLAHPALLDQIRLGEEALAEIEAPEAFAGSRLGQLDLRDRHGVSVLAIRRGPEVMAAPGREAAIESGDLLLLLGDEEAIRRVAALR